MSTAPATAREDVLAPIATAFEELAPDGWGRDFVQRYFRHIPLDDLTSRTPDTFAGAAHSHLQLAKERPSGTANVRVYNPTTEVDGWSTPRTIIQVVTDDMPFLVDSVTGALVQAGIDIHLVIHPQLVVTPRRRRPAPEGREPRRSRKDFRPGAVGELAESWMHRRDRPRGSTTGRRAEIEGTVRSVLERRPRGGRGLAEDAQPGASCWPPSSRGSAARRSTVTRSPRATTFLRLAGRRPLHLPRLPRVHARGRSDDDEVIAAGIVPGLGLLRAILRADQDLDVLAAQAAAAVAARPARRPAGAGEGQLAGHRAPRRPTSTTSASRRFDAARRGRRRAPLPRAVLLDGVHRVGAPGSRCCARRSTQVLDRAGLRPAQPHRQGAARRPRDLPARRAVPDRRSTSCAPIARRPSCTLRERRQLRLFVRRDTYGRFVSCLVYLPRDRYNTAVRERIADDPQGDLRRRARRVHRPGQRVRRSRGSTSSCARPRAQPIRDVDVADARAPARRGGALLARRLHRRRADARVRRGGRRPARATATPTRSPRPTRRTTVAARAGVGRPRPARGRSRATRASTLSLYQPMDGPADVRGAASRCSGSARRCRSPTMLPMLLVAWASRSSTSGRTSSSGLARPVVHLRLRAALPAASCSPDAAASCSRTRSRAVWDGCNEIDGFNRLVLGAGLTVAPGGRAARLRQVPAPGRHAVRPGLHRGRAASATSTSPGCLVELFEARFDPGRNGDLDGDASPRAERRGAAAERISQALDDVASLDEDRILRSYLAVIQATLRTNYFQRDARRGRAPALPLVQARPAAIPDLPEPRPLFEIFVYSPRVEGVHLRGGPVARGGLRWSDRREDFRTEVLGLVKAQMVKNAVIVPVGAKGGFVLQAAARRRRTARRWMAEGVACYQTFISRPARRHRQPGRRRGRCRRRAWCATTATTPTWWSPPTRARRPSPTSPTAVAAEYGFWLGDAFASGGSVGLRPQGDGHHRARRLGVGQAPLPRAAASTPRREDFTVVGIGDMSRRRVRQRHAAVASTSGWSAAFDHRHIFVDPDPDPATSLRRAPAAVRAAALDAGPTTTPTLISRGRRRLRRARAKSIALSAAGRARRSASRPTRDDARPS